MEHDKIEYGTKSPPAGRRSSGTFSAQAAILSVWPGVFFGDYMPTRMLRDWTDSLRFESMPAESERLFIRLIMKADDFGRFHADPRLVRAACYPLEDCTTAKVRDGINELVKRGLLFAYEVDKRPYIAIVNYGQRLKQSRPKFPQPDGESEEWKPTSGNFRELPARREAEGKEKEKEKDSVELPFDTETFRAVWQNWRDHRKAIKKAMTPQAERLALAKLPSSESDAVHWIETAIEKGWQGIYEPKHTGRREETPYDEGAHVT